MALQKMHSKFVNQASSVSLYYLERNYHILTYSEAMALSSSMLLFYVIERKLKTKNVAWLDHLGIDAGIICFPSWKANLVGSFS